MVSRILVQVGKKEEAELLELEHQIKAKVATLLEAHFSERELLTSTS